MANIFLIKIAYYDPTVSGGASGTLYFSSGKGFVTKPSETPANTVFLPAIIDAGDFSRYLYRQDATGGRSEVGKGDVVLNNAGGGLDSMLNYAYDGRTITILFGDDAAAYPSGFTTMFVGTMQQVEVTWDKIIVKIFDKQAYVANQLMCSTTYLGTNSGSTGYEGLAADLKGKYKPFLYGVAYNLPVPCVNTSSLSYQISAGTINSVDAVYDKGVALTPGTARASLAALTAGAPAAGTYDWYLGASSPVDGAYIKLGSTPAGQITVDATQGANAAARTVAQIMNNILTGAGGLTSGDMDTASFTALDTANAAVVGIWVSENGQKVGEALDELARSIGAYWSQTRAGLITVGRLIVPVGTADANFTAYDIIGTIERVSDAEQAATIPNWRVIVEYQKLYRVQSPTDLAAGVTQARVAFLGKERRSSTPAESASTLLAHPLSQTLTRQTLLTASADAVAEASRQQTMYGSRRDLINMAVPRDQVTALDVGDIITITADRYGWNSGKKFVILGIAEQYTRVEDILYLWG